MKCKNCGGWMVLDEWNGWVWYCFNCDTCGRIATDEEIETQQGEYKS
jgi:ssDNA-binding Zn-finger/Zn-ribbon topoisomerase 1